jgi:hypothetical protein
MDLNKEAEKYLKKIDNESGTTWTEDDSDIVKVFANFVKESKYVQAKILQAQIDVLLKHQQKLGGYDMLSGLLKQEIQIDIYELQQQLKQLENEQ